jgi:Golgi SNAP receptor complex protein 1
LEKQVRSSAGRRKGAGQTRAAADHLSQTEASLHTYSQFSTQTAIPPKPTDEEKNAEAKVQELLDKASPPTLGGVDM